MFLRWLALCALFAFAPCALAAFSKPILDRSVFGIPEGEWSYVRQSPQGPESFSIPSQLERVRQLPEPERSEALRAIRERRDNLRFLYRSIDGFLARLKRSPLLAVPEYRQDLGEAMIAVDHELSLSANPLFPHEPVLRALPDYTRIVVLTPANARDKVEARLTALGLNARTRIVVSAATVAPAHDPTRWVRDVLLLARDHNGQLLQPPLAFKDTEHVAANDLGYLDRASDRRHTMPRVPLFFRAGNLAVGEAGRRVLAVGKDELERNAKAYLSAFGFSPLPEALPGILKGATGADEVVFLANTPGLFHIDMYLSFIADGTVALLAPVDPERLLPQDRAVLAQARQELTRLGFRIVPIPTSAERIAHFQSPVNIVVYTDRVTHKSRALVPQFPATTTADAASLNAAVLDAYRQAGLDPIPVEERFFTRGGNTHCALLALH